MQKKKNKGIHQMSIQHAAADPFRADLATMLPRLRIYALSLTRDADRAGDLVQ